MTFYSGSAREPTLVGAFFRALRAFGFHWALFFDVWWVDSGDLLAIRDFGLLNPKFRPLWGLSERFPVDFNL